MSQLTQCTAHTPVDLHYTVFGSAINERFVNTYIHVHSQYDQETVLYYGSNVIAIARISWSQACDSLVVIVCMPSDYVVAEWYETVCTHIVNV